MDLDILASRIQSDVEAIGTELEALHYRIEQGEEPLDYQDAFRSIRQIATTAIRRCRQIETTEDAL